MAAHGWRARSGPAELDVDWMRDGACLTRTDLPWTADTHELRGAERRAMATVCAACPVLARCDGYAAAAHVAAGFWAGRARDESRRPAVVLAATSLAEVGDADDLGGVA